MMGDTLLGNDARIVDIEKKLIEVVRDVLGLESVSPDDFFFDIGGDSLSAMWVVSGIAERLGVEVPVSKLFASSSMHSLAVDVAEHCFGRTP
jgi:acyl carrier protein